MLKSELCSATWRFRGRGPRFLLRVFRKIKKQPMDKVGISARTVKIYLFKLTACKESVILKVRAEKLCQHEYGFDILKQFDSKLSREKPFDK